MLFRSNVYEKIKSPYRISLKSALEAGKFHKLLKAMFILQTELPHYFEFRTNISKQGELEFYFGEVKIVYEDMAEFIKEAYEVGEEKKEDTQNKIGQAKIRLQNLKQIAAMQEIEYLEKEKQISTFLECKKTFFGKFKYFFKYSKKNKKNKIREEEKFEENQEKEENKNDSVELINILFESVSAVTNTGLSITDINTININAEVILMILMYIGRVGPLTMMLAFVNEDERNKLIEYPTENVIL